MWTQARITGYLATLLAGIAFLAMAVGAGTYDPATGLFDLHPIDVKWLAGVIAGPAASALAAIAAFRGWGK
jgi:hypothetical protein